MQLSAGALVAVWSRKLSEAVAEQTSEGFVAGFVTVYD